MAAGEKNIEELHYFNVSLHKGMKKMLNRIEPFSPKGTLQPD
jgi:hypothetical protein